MKRYISWIFGVVYLLFLGSCSEETVVDKVSKQLSSGGVLRTLEVKNELEATDLSSTCRIVLEAQTKDQGRLLKEVRVKVGGYFGKGKDGRYRDTVKLSQFSVISAAEFNKESSNTHGLPVGEFMATLQQSANHVKKTKDQLAHDDKFLLDFEMELTNERIYNRDNASGDIAASSYFNSPFKYDFAINAKQTLITDVDLSSTVKSGGKVNKDIVDTLFLSFNGGKKLNSSNPFFTVGLLGTSSNNDFGTVGTITEKNEGDQYHYYFQYTASDVDRDTISFVIAGAAVHKDIPMDEPDTLKSAFIVDNVIAYEAGQPQVTLDGDSIKSIVIDFNFGEALKFSKKETISFAVTSSSFDDITIEDPVIYKEIEVMTLTFTPKQGSARLAVPAGKLDFDVKVTKAKDEAGNEIDQQTSFSVFN